MNWLFGGENNYDSCTKGSDNSQYNASDLSEKDTGATKSEGWGSHFYVEEVIWNFMVYMVLNQKGGTKCNACETEQPGHE